MYAQQASQAQASHVYRPQSGCVMGDQSMIDSSAQTHLNSPNGTIQAVSNTIPAPQFFYTICPVTTAPLQHGSYSAYAPGLTHATQADYSGYQPYSMMSYTLAHQDHTAFRQGLMHKDAIRPENRRGVYSTNESPGTPFYGSLGHGNCGIVLSPQRTHNVVPQAGKPFPLNAIPVSYNIATLNQTIPGAVPAVFTPRGKVKTLDQSLCNPYGNHNVYIRGLHPDTNDEILAAYARRFGSVETSKAIIDTATGTCKGFGFAKYLDVRDSEKCIRGFHARGYEVGFARESFNSRLKAKGDNSSTNLYVSNLPKSMNEMELAAIFMNYNVVSSRILSGAGFVRFESRAICEDIIGSYHGQPVGEENLLLQVRYADTPAQKDLKKITNERRQFRTTEYNVGAYGSPDDIANISHPMTSAGVSHIAQRSRRPPSN